MGLALKKVEESHHLTFLGNLIAKNLTDPPSALLTPTLCKVDWSAKTEVYAWNTIFDRFGKPDKTFEPVIQF